MDIKKLVHNNQCIKIVPSFEESLCNFGLDIYLEANSILWFEQLKTAWKTWKKSSFTESKMSSFYQSIPDPYRVSLILIIKCEEYKDSKPKTLPYFIAECLEKWSLQTGTVPDNSLKLPAFHIAIYQRNTTFRNYIFKIYNIFSIKNTILPIVKDMIRDDNCRLAVQIVIALKMFEEIPVEKLLFPLVLQDKPNLIDEYLSACPNKVEPLLNFLDMLLDKKFNLHQYIQNFIEENNVTSIKYEKIHRKPLGKLVSRICTKFKIPIEFCKNLSQNRTIGGLRYLIHQKYLEHNVSSSVWEDLVKDALKQNKDSAIEFIDMLIEYDRNEALKWAEFFDIPLDVLSSDLKQMSLRGDSTSSENWDSEPNTFQTEHYKCSLSDAQIVMIDTSEKFYDLTSSVLSHSSVVSIDAEWKPSFGATQSRIALLQVATCTNVYLIDTLILNQPQYSSFWHTFCKCFLENAEIVKIGFGLENDLREMKSTINGLNNIKVKGEGLLDLGSLWKNLINNGLILPYNIDTGGNSLSALVKNCFGLPLQKSEQCSNWEIRPLRKTQIDYAACDAYVLIELYKYLQKLCLEQGFNFDEICNDVMLEKKVKCNKKNEVSDKTENIIKTHSADGVKIFLEADISNLASYLRYCGIDTTVIPTTMLWHDVISVATSESRYILTSKLKYTPRHDFPQTSILDVGKGSIKEQLQRVFATYNISVASNNLNTRCVYCNADKIKTLSAEDVSKIVEIFSSSVGSCKAYEFEEDNNFEGFLSDSDGDEDLYQHASTKPNENCIISDICELPLKIEDINNLKLSSQYVILCDLCGHVYCDRDSLMQSVAKLMSSFLHI